MSRFLQISFVFLYLFFGVITMFNDTFTIDHWILMTIAIGFIFVLGDQE